MKRWIALAARIYPATWRNRYGTEFQALLESVNPGWRELFDVLTGALKMRLTNGATYLKLGAAFALFGAVAAITTSYVLPQTYVSTAELEMRPADTDALKRIESDVLSRTSLSTLIQRHDLDLYREERTSQPLEDVIETMRTRDIKVRIENPTTVGISFGLWPRSAHSPSCSNCPTQSFFRTIRAKAQRHRWCHASGNPGTRQSTRRSQPPAHWSYRNCRRPDPRPFSSRGQQKTERDKHEAVDPTRRQALSNAAWRNRYGSEFQLPCSKTSTPVGAELFDVLKGALKMRLSNGGAYLKLGAAFALFGAITAVTTSFLVPQTYVSKAELRPDKRRLRHHGATTV